MTLLLLLTSAEVEFALPVSVLTWFGVVLFQQNQYLPYWSLLSLDKIKQGLLLSNHIDELKYNKLLACHNNTCHIYICPSTFDDC